MNRPKLTSRYIYGIGVLCCAGITAAAWLFLVSPALQRRQAANDLSREWLDRRRQVAALETRMLVDRRRTAVARQLIARDAIQLQPLSVLNERLAIVNQIAASCGVTLDDIRPDNAADSAHFKTLPIRVSGSGSAPNCVAFVHQIHEALGDTGVKTLSVNGPPPGAKAASATFQLDLVWFAKK